MHEQVVAKLKAAGFHYAGVCFCASRAEMYRKHFMTIKLFKQQQFAKLYFRNKTISGHVAYSKIEELITQANAALHP